MPPDLHKNFAYSTVATAPSPATSGTTLVVATGDGTKFPAVPFNMVIWPTGVQPSVANAEIVRVTAISTDTLTITRAQEGTSARTVVIGDQLDAGITVKTLTDAEGMGLNPTAVKTANYTAVAGDFVPVDTTSGNVTVTFPTAPADGTVIAVKHVIQGSTNVVNLALGGSDVFNKASGSTTGSLSVVSQGIICQYKSSGAIWYVVADDIPLSGLVTPTGTQTLTNKRITKRTLSTSGPGATPTINTDNYDVVVLTALAAAITSMTTNLTGTPGTEDTLRISFTDNGTARTIAWGTSFEASTIALPTTTVISARLDVGFVWNAATSKWRCIGVA